MEDVKRALESVGNVENGSDISASVAVVGGRPDCNQVLVFEPVFESIHHQLMGSSNQLNIIDVVELSGDL